LGEGDTGDGSPIVGGTAAGCGRRITSVPLTGPRQVSPVSGIRRVLPLSAALVDTYVPIRDGVDELPPPLTAGGGLLTASADVGTSTFV
jgi:hypothetical protein